MATHRSAASLLLAQTDRFRKMTGTAQELHARMAEAGYQDHFELTSGSISSKMLRQMGHPFGRGQAPGMGSAPRVTSKAKLAKHGFRGRVPRLPINVQSGRLRRAFYMQRISGRGSQTFTVGNRAPYARFILAPEGTKRMIGRGFGGQVQTGAPANGETVKRWKARNLGLIKNLQARSRHP